MNRIAQRAGIVLVLALVLVVGLIFFVGDYLINGDDWFNFSGNPHSVSSGNGAATVIDRNGQFIMDTRGTWTYSDSEQLRASVIHWLGDRDGNINAPMLEYYSQAFSGFDLINGIYSFSGKGGETTLTISAEAQVAALEALEGYKGTVAVYNYETGEILCAVSTPAYDPDNVPDIVGDTTGKYDGAYYNRFTQISYVPGSIFKVLTTAAALENIDGVEDAVYFCAGSYDVDGNEVTCESVHGEQSLSEALTNSCNCAYAQIALQLGADVLEAYVDKYELTESLSFDGIVTKKGYFSLDEASNPEIAWSAIGQYHDAVNPCRFMTFMGVIAGGGSAAEPYLVSEISAGGSTTYKAKTYSTGRLMTSNTAEKLQTLMRNNVINSYGDENFAGLTVCAKSGTAEVGVGLVSNAMFAGFCLDEDYPLAFFAAVEQGGYGGHTCVPIISSVLEVCKDVMDRE